MPPVTPSRIRLMPEECLLLRAGGVLVDDLALGGLLEGHRQVVLRARLDERRRELVERPLTELVVVVVDLPRALGGDDHAGVERVHLVEQTGETRRNQGPAMLEAASSAPTISARRAAARSRSSFSTT